MSTTHKRPIRQLPKTLVCLCISFVMKELRKNTNLMHQWREPASHWKGTLLSLHHHLSCQTKISCPGGVQWNPIVLVRRHCSSGSLLSWASVTFKHISNNNIQQKLFDNVLNRSSLFQIEVYNEESFPQKGLLLDSQGKMRLVELQALHPECKDLIPQVSPANTISKWTWASCKDWYSQGSDKVALY